jgi:hypothetical protein
MLEHISRKSWLLKSLSAGIALGFVGMTATAQAQDSDSYSLKAQVATPGTTVTCTFANGATPNATAFSFDISWVNQERGQYLLADRSHGFPTINNESGQLTGQNSGDILVIDTSNPGAGFSIILPPASDPFAGVRCDTNDKFGGSTSAGRNEITGPNGIFDVNTNLAWVGDGPQHFTPGHTNSAIDYKNDPCNSSVRVFDLIKQQQIAHINTHGCFRTDEGAFDAVDQIALFANPAENAEVAAIDPNASAIDTAPFITLISTIGRPVPADEAAENASWKSAVSMRKFDILTQINFNGLHGTPNASGGIEQPVYSRQTGLFYIAVPANADAGVGADGFVVSVDPRSGATFGNVVTYPLKGGSCPGGPTGAALGPSMELLLGCGGASAAGGLVVVDITPANIATSVEVSPTIIADTSQGCDEVAYDAGSGHFGAPCRTPTSAGKFELLIDDAHTKTFDTGIVSSAAAGAHSIAADNINAQFWMPKVGGDCTGGAGHACVTVYSGDQSDASGP